MSFNDILTNNPNKRLLNITVNDLNSEGNVVIEGDLTVNGDIINLSSTFNVLGEASGTLIGNVGISGQNYFGMPSGDFAIIPSNVNTSYFYKVFNINNSNFNPSTKIRVKMVVVCNPVEPFLTSDIQFGLTTYNTIEGGSGLIRAIIDTDEIENGFFASPFASSTKVSYTPEFDVPPSGNYIIYVRTTETTNVNTLLCFTASIEFR